MPRRRQGQRTVIPERWRGLNQRIPASMLPPGWFSACTNMETYGGALRPRGGYTEFDRLTVTPSDRVNSIYGHPIKNEADVFLLQALRDANTSDYFVMNAAGTDWERISAETAVYDWANVTTAAHPAGTTNPVLKEGRSTYFTAGGWTIICSPDSPTMAYKRTGASTHRFRRAGFAIAPTEPTNATPSSSPVREGPSHSEVSSNGAGALTNSGVYKYLFTWAEDTYSQLESVSGTLAATITLGAADDTVVISFGSSSSVVNPKDWPPNAFGYGGGDKTNIFAGILRVYRTVAGGDEYYHVGDVTYGGPTFTDLVSDATLISGNPLPTGREAPPENIVSCCYARNRAFYVPADSNVVWYSRADLADTGRSGVEYVPTTNFFTIPTDDKITACCAYGQNVLMFQEDRVWMVDPSPLQDDGTAVPNIYELENAGGASAPHVIAISQPRPTDYPKVFYANVAGAYEFAGQSARCISEDIAYEWQLLSATSWPFASAAWDPHHKRYLLAVQRTADVAGGGLPRVMVYDADSDGWWPWDVPTNVRALGVVRRGPSGATLTDHDLLYHGGSDGKVYYWSHPNQHVLTDDGTAIAWSATTGRMAFGDITALKRLHDLTVALEAASGAAVTVDVYIDDDTSAAKTLTYAIGSTDRFLLMPLGGKARRIQLKFSSASVAALIKILTVTLIHSPRGIRG